MDQANNDKSFLKNILIYVFLGFLSFMVADLILLKFVRMQFFPSFTAKDAAGLRNMRRGGGGSSDEKNSDLARYNQGYKHILNRNMFNSDGVISPPLSSLQKSDGGEGEEEEIYNDPVLSSLPLTLEGTIVHRNPYRSLATVEVGGKALSYTVGDNIDGLAEVISVVRKKVIIRNSDTRKLEYIEIPRDLKIERRKPVVKVVPKPTFGAPEKVKPSVVKREGNTFKAKRSDVNKKLNNLGKLLREAKVERAVDPVTGEVMGFEFKSIKEGSDISDLGFQVGDIIKSVDGEIINSPSTAMRLFNQMKNASELKITINRDGQDQEFDYSIED